MRDVSQRVTSHLLGRYYHNVIDPFHEPVRRQGITDLELSSGERILDVGCGSGRGMETLREAVGRDGSAVGIDVSVNMCRLASQKAPDVIRGDAMALPCQRDRFDAILVSFTLELFDAKERSLVLAELRRVLHPDGRICVIAPSTADPVVAPLYSRLNDALPRLIDSRPFDVAGEIAKEGLDIVGIRRTRAPIISVDVVIAEHASTKL